MMRGEINKDGFLYNQKLYLFEKDPDLKKNKQECPFCYAHPDVRAFCSIYCANSQYLTNPDGSEVFVTCQGVEYLIKEAVKPAPEDFDLDIDTSISKTLKQRSFDMPPGPVPTHVLLDLLGGALFVVLCVILGIIVLVGW